MVELGKYLGFTLYFDRSRPFTPRKIEWQPIKSPNSLYPRIEVEQQTLSGDKIETV